MYADLIDQAIARCDAKPTLRSSRSEKLRQAAAIACLKSAYLKNYREQIIAGPGAVLYQLYVLQSTATKDDGCNDKVGQCQSGRYALIAAQS